jgi:hypothetical protein
LLVGTSFARGCRSCAAYVVGRLTGPTPTIQMYCTERKKEKKKKRKKERKKRKEKKVKQTSFPQSRCSSTVGTTG